MSLTLSLAHRSSSPGSGNFRSPPRSPGGVIAQSMFRRRGALSHDDERECHGLRAPAGVACAEDRIVGAGAEPAEADAPAEGDAAGSLGLDRACQRGYGRSALSSI